MRLRDWIQFLFPSFGGGGSKIPQFKVSGNPPSFDYQSAAGLNQLAIGTDVTDYAASDQDFASRYPQLQQAYNQYQANLGQQIGETAQGYGQQSQIQTGLANTIAGRQANQTTADINNVRNQAATAAQATQPIYNLAGQQGATGGQMVGLGRQQAGYAAPITQLGYQQAGMANPITGLAGRQAGQAGLLNQYGGQLGGLGLQQAGMGMQQAGYGAGIAGEGGQLAQAAQTPYRVGQQLLQEPIDPMTQQQMAKAGLSSAAGALGAASLGQGMAGQAAAARQLGLSTLQYGQAMRGEAMQDISQYGSMLGQAGQMQGLGASTIGAGAATVGGGGQTIGTGGQMYSQAGAQLQGAGQGYGLAGQQIGAGAQTVGLGASQLGQGAATMGAGAGQMGAAGQTYATGAGTAATAGGLYGQAQGLQEQYGMDTAQMASLYGNMQNQMAVNTLGSVANANQMFAKRNFGIGGTNAAQSELGQANALNAFNQANYATMNDVASQQQQIGAQNAQLSQANASANAGIGVSVATTAVMVASNFACWVARAIYPDDRWKIFRHWLMNKAPVSLRQLYLRRGEAFSQLVKQNYLLRLAIKLLMDRVIERTTYVNSYLYT